jgi:hypothetical protein
VGVGILHINIAGLRCIVDENPNQPYNWLVNNIQGALKILCSLPEMAILIKSNDLLIIF